jgi:ribonuclease R
MHDETTQTLTGRKTRQVFRLAQTVDVRLIEAAPITGGLLFALTATRARTTSATVKTDRTGRKSGRKRQAR